MTPAERAELAARLAAVVAGEHLIPADSPWRAELVQRFATGVTPHTLCPDVPAALAWWFPAKRAIVCRNHASMAFDLPGEECDRCGRAGMANNYGALALTVHAGPIVVAYQVCSHCLGDLVGEP